MKLVILITVRTEQSIALAEAWERAGAVGITIVEGSGRRSVQLNLHYPCNLQSGTMQ